MEIRYSTNRYSRAVVRLIILLLNYSFRCCYCHLLFESQFYFTWHFLLYLLYDTIKYGEIYKLWINFVFEANDRVFFSDWECLLNGYLRWMEHSTDCLFQSIRKTVWIRFTRCLKDKLAACLFYSHSHKLLEYLCHNSHQWLNNK